MRALRVALQVILVPPALAGATVGALMAVAGQLGRGSLTFDIVTHFAPIWVGGGLAGLMAAWMVRGWFRFAMLGWSAVAVLAGGALVVPELLRSTGPMAAQSSREQLKIVQLNIWYKNRNFDEVWRWLEAVDADIVVLEETSGALRRYATARPGWHVSCDECEVMILSRQAPVRSKQARLLGPKPGPLTRVVFRDRRGEFAVIGVHYAWPTDVGDQQAQEQGLATMIARSGRDRVIVTGDFNSTPWSFSRRRWDAAFGIPRRDRALASWPARRGAFPVLPIDHVYAGKDWATVKVERGPRLGSDHYPVVMTLAPVSRP